MENEEAGPSDSREPGFERGWDAPEKGWRRTRVPDTKIDLVCPKENGVDIKFHPDVMPDNLEVASTMCDVCIGSFPVGECTRLSCPKCNITIDKCARCIDRPWHRGCRRFPGYECDGCLCGVLRADAKVAYRAFMTGNGENIEVSSVFCPICMRRSLRPPREDGLTVYYGHTVVVRFEETNEVERPDSEEESEEE